MSPLSVLDCSALPLQPSASEVRHCWHLASLYFLCAGAARGERRRQAHGAFCRRGAPQDDPSVATAFQCVGRAPYGPDSTARICTRLRASAAACAGAAREPQLEANLDIYADYGLPPQPGNPNIKPTLAALAASGAVRTWDPQHWQAGSG